MQLNGRGKLYISAFTDFEISRKTPFVVRFTEDLVAENEVGAVIETDLMTIDPEISFSSYLGSGSSNFGNTATYDDDGNFIERA